MSTVVGVATGMFTLRDQVLPREAGTAAAVPVSVYEQRVGRICEELNDNDRTRAREQKATRRQLERARTTISQRNALLDGVRRTAARSAHALASFTALEAPPTRVSTRNDTAAAWNRNLARVRGYAVRLDHAGTRARLVAALGHLSAIRPLLARDGDKIDSGLQRLGAANCDLRPAIVTPSFKLPPLRTDDSHAGGTSTPDTTHRAEGTRPGNGAAEVSATTPGGGGDASGPESATTPENDDSEVSATTPDAETNDSLVPEVPDTPVPETGGDGGASGDDTGGDVAEDA